MKEKGGERGNEPSRDPDVELHAWMIELRQTPVDEAKFALGVVD